jgi:prepilin-type N-terminal cleavage/methylation domain-containing protein
MYAHAERDRKPRRGVSLLELLVVVVLLGIFAATAAMRFGRTVLGEYGARGTARELSLALLTCQRAAIASGDDHYVEFLSTGGEIVQYRLMRDVGGTPVLVDGPKNLAPDVTVTSSHPTLRFDFEGSAAANYTVSVSGTDRAWSISVVPITGATSVTQTS